jgi:hypothetical protein
MGALRGRTFTMRTITGGWLGALVAGACWCASSAAHAQPIPPCDSLPNVIYGSGGSAQKPFVAKVARVLAGLATPTTIVYQSAGGACQGIYNLLDDADATPPLTGNQPYWLPDGTERQCSAPITGARTTFALMGNTTAACAGVTPADVATLSDSLGPVGTVNFLVPNASSQQSISAEALYFVYGFGGVAGQVEPWTLDTAIGTRNANSFAAIFAALYAGVPLSRLATTGTDVLTNSGTVTFLNNAAAAGNAESAIAFASGEVPTRTARRCARWRCNRANRPARTGPTRARRPSTRSTCAMVTTSSGPRRTSTRARSAGSSRTSRRAT